MIRSYDFLFSLEIYKMYDIPIGQEIYNKLFLFSLEIYEDLLEKIDKACQKHFLFSLEIYAKANMQPKSM